jgi:hypothetical protein
LLDGERHVGRPAALGRLGRDPNDLRRPLVVVDQCGDGPTEGRREQRRLAALRRLAEESPDGGQEADVGHPVGLVDHDELDGVEHEVAALDQVLEPAGAADHQVDAAPQSLALRADGDATEDRGNGRSVAPGERDEHVDDLGGELACRRQDERCGPAGLAHAAALEQRESEGERLARSGRCLGGDVTAGEGLGDGGLLDRRGVGQALRVQASRQVGGHAEFGEGGHGRTPIARIVAGCTPR